MKRRKFLYTLAAAPVLAKAGPVLQMFPCADGAYQWEFADYATFSEMARQWTFDPVVLEAARELGILHSQRIDALLFQLSP